MHGLQPVAHVGQRAAHDHTHRVVEVGAFHLLLDGDRGRHGRIAAGRLARWRGGRWRLSPIAGKIVGRQGIRSHSATRTLRAARLQQTLLNSQCCRCEMHVPPADLSMHGSLRPKSRDGLRLTSSSRFIQLASSASGPGSEFRRLRPLPAWIPPIDRRSIRGPGCRRWQARGLCRPPSPLVVKKGSNTWLWSPSGIPGPSSCTVTRT